MWRGFSEPALASSTEAQHSGPTTLVSGALSLSQMEQSLERQQKMIEELLQNQRQQQQSQSHLSSSSAASTAASSAASMTLGSMGERDFASEQPATMQPTYTAPAEQPTKRHTQAVSAPPPAAVPPPPPAAVLAPEQPANDQPVGHSHSAKGWEPAVVAHALENTIKAAAAARALLKQRYGEALAARLFTLDPMVSYSAGSRRKAAERAGTPPQDVPPATPTFLDPDSRALLVKRVLAKLAAPTGDAAAKRFVVAFGGHSSAAAHGNYFNQSYAHAFERLLKPAFAAAGLELVVRNHAMGGTGCVPSAYCVANVYGDDLDALSWDFGMTDGRNVDHAELYFRQAVLQTRKAANRSPGRSRGPRLAPVLVLAHNTDNPREELLKHYAAAGFEVAGIRMNQAVDLVPKTKGPAHAASLPDALRYLECDASVAWEDCKAQRYDCTQRCGAGAGAACHGQVSWHPGWRYHQLKGDLLAVPMLEALSDAARQYQAYTMEMGPGLDPEVYDRGDPPPLPPPLLCGRAGSSVDPRFCDLAFSCATSFEPRTGPSPLELRAAAYRGVPSAPTGPKYQSGAAARPPADNNAQALARMAADAAAPSGANWHAALAPGEGDNTEACTGHVDQKFNTVARGGGGWLAIDLPRLEAGVVIVCEGPFSARYAKQVGYLNTSSEGGNAALEVDGQPAHYDRKLSKSLCSVVSDRLAPGNHTVALQALQLSLTGFSHIIWA